MIYNIIAVPSFRKELKKLAKKYRSLKDEMTSLFNSLEKNPTAGTAIGKNCYKIRIAIASKGKGKSGGARIITNFIVTDSTVYLLSIYDKSEKDNISDKELIELLAEISE
ncbi:type II toxin-antitoxin system RelE/ParE family toxin [Pedobacter aquatilis]|uniref:type II toxin-antitoxin system RelE/ParE family toxin n=1 Tax=Pedobacter aquatilis TaxID=351343 RepID=UPI00292CD907|nr:type II toxin-antitoxin system RelE/ParE family toxin [Pedobacter aquatilis]